MLDTVTFVDCAEAHIAVIRMTDSFATDEMSRTTKICYRRKTPHFLHENRAQYNR